MHKQILLLVLNLATTGFVVAKCPVPQFSLVNRKSSRISTSHFMIEICEGLNTRMGRLTSSLLIYLDQFVLRGGVPHRGRLHGKLGVVSHLGRGQVCKKARQIPNKMTFRAYRTGDCTSRTCWLFVGLSSVSC